MAKKPCTKVAYRTKAAAESAQRRAYRPPPGFRSRPSAYECGTCLTGQGSKAWHWTKGLWKR